MFMIYHDEHVLDTLPEAGDANPHRLGPRLRRGAKPAELTATLHATVSNALQPARTARDRVQKGAATDVTLVSLRPCARAKARRSEAVDTHRTA